MRLGYVMGKCNQQQAAPANNSINPMVMMMMMQLMQQTNDMKGMLDRILGHLEGRGQYTPGMQNYLGNVLNQMPTMPGQQPYGAFMLPPATYAAMSPNLPLRSFLNGTII